MILVCLIIVNFLLTTSSESVPPTSGFYTGDLNNVIDKFEIVYPERISKDGSFVSYYLPHYYNIEPMENRPRRHPRQTRSSDTGEIHFFIPIEGKQYHLKLWPNWNFLAPGLIVEKRDATNVQNINKAKIKQVSRRQCHYSGEIVGQPNSNVALSTCYGLAGYIRVPDVDEYLIEPLKDSKPTSNQEHPHIIYKRSDIKDKSGGSNCLTKGKAKEALNERMQWEAMYGNRIHDELSEININELVQESVKSLNYELPQIGKLNLHNGLDQTENKIETNNYINTNSFDQNPHFQKPQLKTDSQLKNNHFSEETNVSLKFPNENLKFFSKSPYEKKFLRSGRSLYENNQPCFKSKKIPNVSKNKIFQDEKTKKLDLISGNEKNVDKIKYFNQLKIKPSNEDLKISVRSFEKHSKEGSVLTKSKTDNTDSELRNQHDDDDRSEYNKEISQQYPIRVDGVDQDSPIKRLVTLQNTLKEEPRAIAENMIDKNLVKVKENIPKNIFALTIKQDIAMMEGKSHDRSNLATEIKYPPLIEEGINKQSIPRKVQKTTIKTEINNAAFAKSKTQEESKCSYKNISSVNHNERQYNKRQIWPDDCSLETTTEKNLLCFDFANKVFNLELMITVDYKVIKMHADDDIENFILTVINMVSANFYDKSIGINLSVSLVRLILLTTCIKELDSDRFTPEELLENFCTWQVLINPGKDDHPHHHDLAIFVTRMDKCEGQVMGVAYMTSVCRPDKACIVCVDEGLLLANTITHQIGHALGAEHDESGGSTPDGILFHMAPKISEASSTWSVCSKDAMTQFVKSQGSWCLTDFPLERQFNFPLILPGQVYSAAQQCKLNFHFTAIPCFIGPFCEKLYCQVTEKLCATKGDPPADGTFCASDMWCFHKQCVHVGRRPGSVSGEWGPWTEWSLCTRSCGGGVANSYRICNNPKPANGGRYCVGDRIRYKMCHTKPCQGFSESFRDFQCKKTEDRPFRGRLHNWIQYHSFFVNIECSLICKNRKGEVVMRSPVVADGTPCKAGTRNVCIQGTCRNVGCDWVIDSMAREDACGICQGNGTECRIVQGSFDEPATGKGLVEFLRIPKDSGMIFVREIAASDNVIVVSGAINHVFYVNGQGTEDTMPGDITLGLTHGVYEVRSGMERIFIRGPTTEDLIFYVQFKEPNKGIHYQYAVSEIDPSYAPLYLWQFVDWDPCTDPCSGGAQRAHAKCVEDRAGVVDDKYCSESTRLMDVIRPCNDFPCQAKWWVSVWSDCICTSFSSVMFRSVLCMRATDESGTRAEIVRESECAAHKKPSTQKPCNSTEDQVECVIKRSAHENDDYRVSRNIKREISSNISLQSDDSTTNGLQNSQLQAKDISNIEEIKESYYSTDSQSKYSQPKTYNEYQNLASQVKSIDEISSLKNTSSIDEQPSFVQNSNLINITPNVVESLLVKGKDNQVVSLNSLPNSLQKFNVNDMKMLSSDKETDLASNSNCQSDVQTEKLCEKSQVTCPSLLPETTEATTCRQTCPVQSHGKTLCCKPRPKLPCTKPSQTTTMRPRVAETDELNMKNFALNVVPLDIPKQKKLPQTDPEFIHLGNLGEFGVGDEANGTLLTGQDALDLLDFARRSNASEESVAQQNT